jgi:transposase
MKISQVEQKSNKKGVMDVSVDVHKDMLNFFFEAGGKEYSDECANRAATVKARLHGYHRIATAKGMDTLRIICEPTGDYHTKLLRIARTMGFSTCFVNTESVARFRMIETNDTGKTDTKDPRVIRTLGKLGKVITHQILDENYLMLRKLGKIYDETDTAITRLKCRIDKLLLELFCDYSFQKDFLYARSGLALIQCYHGNPVRILKSGYRAFCFRMRKRAPHIQTQTLKRLWDDAQSSILNERPEGYLKLLEAHLEQLVDDCLAQKQRKDAIERAMIDLIRQLREEDPRIPPSTPGVINDKNIARLLGETGPLHEFTGWRTVMRYGGLNICMRKSGRYQGQNKISKKGRSLLRKVLHHIVLPLVKKGALYGSYYDRKRQIEKMPGTKAMVCVARNFLKKFYGWYRSGEMFNHERFFSCGTQQKAVA